MAVILRNLKKAGIEITFDEELSQQDKTWLASNYFRWSKFNNLYWKKFSEKDWTAVHEYFSVPLLDAIEDIPEPAIVILIESELVKEPVMTEIPKGLQKSVLFLLGLHKSKLEGKGTGGYDINLFKSSLYGKLKTMHKNGKQAQVDAILEYLGKTNQELGIPPVFTLAHGINKLKSKPQAEPEKAELIIEQQIKSIESDQAAQKVEQEKKDELEQTLSLSVRDLENKTIPELDELIKQLEEGMTDILHNEKDLPRAKKLQELIGTIIDLRNRDNAEYNRVIGNQFAPSGNKTDSIRPDFMTKNLLKGREIQLSMPNGEKRNALFAIVELNNIIASHNEENFHSEPLYPKNASGNKINDRNYSGDLSAQKAVMDYARELEPERLITTSRTPSGTPIITKDGFVVSGNNRTMSLKLAAKQYPENYKEYVKFLGEEAESFGFDNVTSISLRLGNSISLPGSSFHNPLSVKFTHPVLVRIDLDFPEYTTQELAKYNKDTKKSERPIDKAIKLSNILRDNSSCAEIIASIVGEYETFTEFYANIAGQKRLAKTLIECNLLTEQELPAFFSETTFTEAGKEFIESLLAALILDREALLATEEPGIKSTRQKLLTALPVLMKNASLPEGSLKQKINDAVILQYNIKGSTFADFIRQRTMFGTTYDKQTVYLNRLIDSGKIKFKQAIEGYNDAIMQNQGASLFGEKPSLDEIFNHWIVGGVSETDKKLIEGSDIVSKGEVTENEQIIKVTERVPSDFKQHIDSYLKTGVIEKFNHENFMVAIYDDKTNKFPTSTIRFPKNININLDHLSDVPTLYFGEKPSIYINAYYAFVHELSHTTDTEPIIMPDDWDNYINSPQEKRAILAADNWLKGIKPDTKIPLDVISPDYEPKFDEQYLNDKIEAATPNLSKIKDVDAYLDEIRGEEPELDKIFLREAEGLKIFLVDGEVVRKDHIEFVSGGHGYVYDWVPKNEVWIDENQKYKPNDMEATIKHELFEIGKMRDEGMSYDDAHELANAMEIEVRNEPEVELPPIQIQPKKYARLNRPFNNRQEGDIGEVMGRPNMFVSDILFEGEKTNQRIDNMYLEFIKEPFKEESPKTRTDSFNFQIFTNKGYFNRSATGNRVTFSESPDMGYQYSLPEAREFAKNIAKEKPELEFIHIVKYSKDWFNDENYKPEIIETIKAVSKPEVKDIFPEIAKLNISDYKSEFELNKAIENILDAKWNGTREDFTEHELEFISAYSGYGGLDDEAFKAGQKLDTKSLYEFYTPDLVIEKMWGLAYKYGYNEGRLIEPAASIGLFLSRKYVKSSVIKDAYEINKYSAKICKLLYPEVNVNDGAETKFFEQLFIKNNYTVRGNVSPVHDLVIGNPPYGKFEGLFAGMGEKSYSHATNHIDYFIFRGLDLLKKDGLLIYIIGAEVAAGGKPWLDQGDSKCKQLIAAKGKLLDAYRLPEGLFARTNVVTDVVIFRKR